MVTSASPAIARSARRLIHVPLTLAGALLLTAQVPAPRPVTLADVRGLRPAALAARWNVDPRRITHKRLCGSIPGTGCETGGFVRAVIFSTDFTPTRFPDLCASEQVRGDLTSDAKASTDVVSVRHWRPLRVFRLGNPCIGKPRKNETRGDFQVIIAERSATPADAWRVVQAARLARSALARRAVPVECEPIYYMRSTLCGDPAGALAEARLETMYRTEISFATGSDDQVIRVDTWGTVESLSTHVRVDMHLANASADPGSPRALRAVKLREHLFVD